MNRISAICILAIALVAACTGAMAQQQGLRANIPFDFTVGDTSMPAGEYSISSPSYDVLELKSDSHIVLIASSRSYNESNSGGRLVFGKYGDQYFLHEVLCPSLDSLNLRVSTSKTEKRARESVMEASAHGSGEQTMVAARWR